MVATLRCVRGKRLHDYLRGQLTAADRATTESHIALCASCRRVVMAAAEILALRFSADELRSELAKANEVVANIEALDERRPDRLVAHSEWGQNPFVAGRLLERSREEFERAPEKALRLARAALAIGQRINAADLEFESWRDCISLYMRLGRCSYAVDAIERAERLAPLTENPEFARGLVLYGRAFVASDPEVWHLDEALIWAEEASRIFARTDERRVRAAAELRAYVHHLRGEHAAAVAITRPLWDAERDVNLGISFVNYLIADGQAGAAVDELLVWTWSNTPPSATVLLARIAWAEGRARSAQSRWQDAVSALNYASSLYRSVSMVEPAIRVDFSRIRAQVNANHEWSLSVYEDALGDLHELLKESTELDSREPSRRRRFTAEALEYAKELAAAATLTTDLLTYVDEYLDGLWSGPPRRFVRPVPAHPM
jgi:tetratricopeptide (TPR) repeat protein